MKKNPICYICGWCQQCDEIHENKCIETNYALFATKEDKEMCDLMCGGIDEETKLEEN